MSEFPYQLVAFLDTEPAIGEPVYSGENGWYPQIALKRRFKINGIRENELFDMIAEFSSSYYGFAITTNGVTQPDRMPVKIIEVEKAVDIMQFHADFIEFMGENITSRFPERDGDNYLPHITIEYDGKVVVDDSLYTDKQIVIEKIFLLKDETDENSIAYKSFLLR